MRYWYAPLRAGLLGLRTTPNDKGNPYPGEAVELRRESYVTIKKNREDELVELDEFGLPIVPEEDEFGFPI